MVKLVEGQGENLIIDSFVQFSNWPHMKKMTKLNTNGLSTTIIDYNVLCIVKKVYNFVDINFQISVN